MKEDKAGNTKARRITAKMKEEWASELDKNGHLFCPMIGCFKKFITVANFQTHYKWCTGKKDLQKCPYCDSLIIAAQKSVIQHMEAFHPERVDDYKRTYCLADSEVDSSFVASENDATMHSEEVYDETVQSSKRRKYSCKENKSSNKVIWKHKMKSINEATMKNIDQFQKCVRFDSIVDKINSVDEVVHTIEEIQKATDVKSTKIKKQKHCLPENVIEKELYFEDSEDYYTDQEISEQDSKVKNTGTKAIFVLDKDCYKRYHENLTMTRDWSTARKTYTRSRNSDSFNDSLSSAQVLSDQSQEPFLINDNLTKYVSLTQQTNLKAQDTESFNSPNEADCSIKLHDKHQLNESIESKNLFLHLEPQNIDSEIVLKTPVKTLEIDLVVQPHQYCELKQNLYEDDLQRNLQLNSKEQKNVILFENKTENKFTRISRKQVPLAPIITYGAQVSDDQCISSRDSKVDFNNLMMNADEAVFADRISKNSLKNNLNPDEPSSPNILKENQTIWKRLVQRYSYSKYSHLKKTQNMKTKLNFLSLFVNKSTKGKNLKQSTQTLNKLKRMKNASTVVKKIMAERQMARKHQLSSKIKSVNSKRKNQFQSTVSHKKNHIQTKSKKNSHFVRKGKLIEIDGCKRDDTKFKSFSEVSDFLYEQTAASYNKVISNVILDCEASLTDYEIVNAENGNILHNVTVSGEDNENEKGTNCLTNEISSNVQTKENSVTYDKTNVSREIIEEVQLISNLSTSLMSTKLSSEIDQSNSCSLSSARSILEFKKPPYSKKEIFSDLHSSENLTTSINESQVNDIEYKNDNLDKYVDLKKGDREAKYIKRIPISPVEEKLSSNFSSSTKIISSDISEQLTSDKLSVSIKCLPEVSDEKTKLIAITSQVDNGNSITNYGKEYLKALGESNQIEVVHNSTFQKVSSSSIIEQTQNLLNFNSLPENLSYDACLTETIIESENNLSHTCKKSFDANLIELGNDLSHTCEKSIDANFNESDKTKRTRGRPKKKVRNRPLSSPTSNMVSNITTFIESKSILKNDKSIDDGLIISENFLTAEVQHNTNIQESNKLFNSLSSDMPSAFLSSDKPSDILSLNKTSDILSSEKLSDILSSDKLSVPSSDKPSVILTLDKPSDILSSYQSSAIISFSKPGIISSDKPSDIPSDESSDISSSKPDIISSNNPSGKLSDLSPDDKLFDSTSSVQPSNILSDTPSDLYSKSRTHKNESQEKLINKINIAVSESSEQTKQSIKKCKSLVTTKKEEFIPEISNQKCNVNATKKKRGRPKKLTRKDSPQDNQNTLYKTESVSLIKEDFASEQFSSTSTPTRTSARIKLKRSSLKHSNSESEHNQSISNIDNNSTISNSGIVTDSCSNNLTFDVSESSLVENNNSILEQKETFIDMKQTVKSSKTTPSIYKKIKGKRGKSSPFLESSNLSKTESNLSALSNYFDESITQNKEKDNSHELQPSRDLSKPIKKRGRPRKNFNLSNQSSASLTDSQKMEQFDNSTSASVDKLKSSVDAAITPHSEKKTGRRSRHPKCMLMDTSVAEKQRKETSKELSKKDLEKSRTTGSLQIAKTYDPNSRKSPRKGQPKKCARYADINSAVENCDQILDSSSNDELEVLANMKKRKRRKQEQIALENEINFNETQQISDTSSSITEKFNDNSLIKKTLKKQVLRKDKLLKDESSSVEVLCDLPLELESKDNNDFVILITGYDKLKLKVNFDNFKPMKGQWKILSESEQVQYYPPMIKSLPIQNLSNQTDVELNCFENTSLDSNQRHFALFVGGPIWSTAWCPTPNIKAIQYVAIATSLNLAEYHSYVANNETKCLIQLWNLGYLEDSSLQQPPSLQLCLAFNYGNVFDMEWCPYGCWEDPSLKTTSEALPRLGLLAIASSDSFIRIYSFAHPGISVSNFPLYEASPSAILKPLNSNLGSFTEKSACVTVCWEKSSDCEKIAGGYGNGLVCVWLLNTSSSLLTRNGEEVTFIPYLIFNAHGTPVTNLAFSPLSKNQWLVSNGFEKEVKFWDLNDTCMPSAIIKDGYASNVNWAAQCSGALINYHETVSFRATQFYRELDLESSTGTSMDDCTSTPRITAYSEVMNALAIVDKTGAITTKFTNTLHSIFKNSKNFPRRKTYAGKLIIPPLKHHEDNGTEPFHDYSLSAVNTISWNPNPSSRFWLIAGGHSGIARFSNVHDLKMDHCNS